MFFFFPQKEKIHQRPPCWPPVEAKQSRETVDGKQHASWEQLLYGDVIEIKSDATLANINVMREIFQ